MSQPSHSIRAHLTLWDTVSIIIGIVIGAGIYETAPLIFKNVSGAWMGLAAWGLGGLLSLCGAFCYAELASTYPRSGGDYVYLTKAFGSWAGFLFGWAQMTVIMTGSIGMMAYVFANYATKLWDLGPNSMFLYAGAAVVFATFTNIFGLVFGKRAQNFLTLVKILGLTGILIAGFFWSNPRAGGPPLIAPEPGSFGLAMVLVLYTYGGWNDAAFVAAEVNDKRRNIPRALILGIVALTIIYLLINSAYLLAMGFEGVRSSSAIAADVLQQPLGDFGAKAMSLLVMISALGAVNGLTYTGSRIYSTVGQDFSFASWLARWHSSGSPVVSLITQGIITLLLIAIVGSTTAREGLNTVLTTAGVSAISWEGHGGFDTLLRCTAPVFWLFFLMTGISLFILRRKDRNVERPFSVPFYPLLPIVFCGTCLYMLYSAAMYAGQLIIVGIIPLIAGTLIYLIFIRSETRNQLERKEIK